MEKEITLAPGNNLESTVYTLLAAKARGEHVFCVFNGHKFHSDTITMDSAYMEVMGCTKEEYDRMKEKRRENYIEEQKIANEKANGRIPSWIERGQALIFPEKIEKWKKWVESRATDLYHGVDLDYALEIMEALDQGASMEEAKKILRSQDNSGASERMVRRTVFEFSSQGPEFWEATSYVEISPEDQKIIEAKKEENKQLLEAYAKTEGNGRHM